MHLCSLLRNLKFYNLSWGVFYFLLAFLKEDFFVETNNKINSRLYCLYIIFNLDFGLSINVKVSVEMFSKF